MSCDDSELRSEVPEIRRRPFVGAAIRPEGDFVVYWMTAFRRLGWNFALQRAVDWARQLRRPLLVVEVLSCGNRWDSDRHHRFVLDGMAFHSRSTRGRPFTYYPYVEPEPGAASKLLAALSAQELPDRG